MKNNYSERNENLFPYVEYPREITLEFNWNEFDGKRAEEDAKKFNESKLGKMILEVGKKN